MDNHNLTEFIKENLLDDLFSGQNWQFCVSCEVWLKTLQNNRVPLLYYVKLCASL